MGCCQSGYCRKGYGEDVSDAVHVEIAQYSCKIKKKTWKIKAKTA